MKQKLWELRGERDSTTEIVKRLQYLLTIFYRTTRQYLNKGIENLTQ